MAAVHLIKTYCLPTLMYGCEVWSLMESSLRTVNVVWNNCLGRIFGCWWRESMNPLQYYCNALPISCLIDARRLIFWQKIRRCDNVVLMALSSLKYIRFTATGAKYDVSIMMCQLKMQYGAALLHLLIIIMIMTSGWGLQQRPTSPITKNTVH